MEEIDSVDVAKALMIEANKNHFICGQIFWTMERTKTHRLDTHPVHRGKWQQKCLISNGLKKSETGWLMTISVKSLGDQKMPNEEIQFEVPASFQVEDPTITDHEQNPDGQASL